MAYGRVHYHVSVSAPSSDQGYAVQRFDSYNQSRQKFEEVGNNLLLLNREENLIDNNQYVMSFKNGDRTRWWPCIKETCTIGQEE